MKGLQSNNPFKAFGCSRVCCQVYLIHDRIRDLYKIGRSNCAKTRFKRLKTANAGIEMITFYDGVIDDETVLHRHFEIAGKHIDGEWFSLNELDIADIEKYFYFQSLPF